MDRQTLRWLAFSLGVDAADADQDQRNEQKSIISCSQLSSFCFEGSCSFACRRLLFLILLFASVFVSLPEGRF